MKKILNYKEERKYGKWRKLQRLKKSRKLYICKKTKQKRIESSKEKEIGEEEYAEKIKPKE